MDNLPPELISQAFLAGLPSLDELEYEYPTFQTAPSEMLQREFFIPESTVQLPFVLASVSRRWRAIALACPALWAFLHMKFSSNHTCIPIPILQLAIDRSGSYPLTIVLEAWPVGVAISPPPASVLCKYFETLLRVSRRWQYFFLTARSLVCWEEAQLAELPPLPEAWVSPRSFEFTAPQLKAASIVSNYYPGPPLGTYPLLLRILYVLTRTIGSAPHIETLHCSVQELSHTVVNPVPIEFINNLVASPEASGLDLIHLRDILLNGADVAAALKILRLAPRLEQANFSWNEDNSVPLNFSGWRSEYNPAMAPAVIAASSLKSLRLSSTFEEQGQTLSSAILLNSISAPKLKELAIECWSPGCLVDQAQIRCSISSFMQRSQSALVHFSLDYQSCLDPPYTHDLWFPNAITDHPLPVVQNPGCWRAIATLHIEQISVWTLFKVLPCCVQLEDLRLSLLTEPGAVRATHEYCAAPSIALSALRSLSVSGGDHQQTSREPECWTRLPELLDSITASALEKIKIVFGCARYEHSEQWPMRQFLSFLERPQCRIRVLDLQGGLTPADVLLILPHRAIGSHLCELNIDLFAIGSSSFIASGRIPVASRWILAIVDDEKPDLISFLRAESPPPGMPSHRLPSLRSLSLDSIHFSFEEEVLNMIELRRELIGLQFGSTHLIGLDQDCKFRFGNTKCVGEQLDD